MATVKYSAVAFAAGLGLSVGAALSFYLARKASQSAAPKIWGTQPHPGWEPPKKLPVPPAIENGKMVAIDPRVIGGKKCYPLIISAVVPRPIAFVSTVSKECFLSLESPPTRVCGADTPFPLVWEPFYLPRQAKVVAEIKESLNF